MVIHPDMEGITHINISQSSKTALGQQLDKLIVECERQCPPSSLLSGLRQALNSRPDIKKMLLTTPLPFSRYYSEIKGEGPISDSTEDEVLSYLSKVSCYLKGNESKSKHKMFPNQPLELIVELVTCWEKNPKTGLIEEVVSHGINASSGRTVILPLETPQFLNAKFDPSGHGWYLTLDTPSKRSQ